MNKGEACDRRWEGKEGRHRKGGGHDSEGGERQPIMTLSIPQPFRVHLGLGPLRLEQFRTRGRRRLDDDELPVYLIMPLPQEHPQTRAGERAPYGAHSHQLLPEVRSEIRHELFEDTGVGAAIP